MTTPTFSVIVPTRNNLPCLTACLRAIYETSPPDTEVIVVGNGDLHDDQGTAGYIDGLAETATLPTQFVSISPQGGFAPAANAGLAVAQGKFLVVLHDDALPTRGWLLGLRSALRTASALEPSTTWGLVGPKLNFGMPGQLLQGPDWAAASKPDCAEETAAQLRSAGGVVEYTSTAALDSACLMLTRDAYTALGGFDADTFPVAGFEDVDLVRTALERGISACVAARVFVYHRGRLTSRRYAPMIHDDLAGLEEFAQKWQQQTAPTKLGVLLRAQVRSMTDAALLTEQLRQLHALTDVACIVDDGSTIPIENLIKELDMGAWAKFVHRNEPAATDNTQRDWTRLAEMGRATDATWLLRMEPGWVLAPKVTRARLEALCRPVDATTVAYRAAIRTCWRSKDYFRVDEEWGRRMDVVLYRNLNFGGVGDPQSIGAPVRLWPSALPKNGMRFTASVLLHDRSYIDLDAARLRGLAFSELPHLMVPAASPTVTLLLMVKNEEDEMMRQLVLHRDWADAMVVVDTGSTDRTAAICEAFGVPVTPYQCCAQWQDPTHLLCDFAAARNFSIDQCETDYILFLDADEELQPLGYASLPHLLLEGADGFLTEIHNHQQQRTTGKFTIYQTLQARLFRKHPLLRYETPIHETLEHAFKRNRKTLSLIRSDLIIDHWGSVREKEGERDWKGERYAALLLKAIEADPMDARSLYALGQHYNAMRRYDEGDPLLGKALAIDENFFSARMELGLRFMRRAYDLYAGCPPQSCPDDHKREVVSRILGVLHPWVAAQ